MEENNKTYTVYMHISPSDKKYVGITKNEPVHRWDNGNGYRSSPHFWKAIKKYGWNNFRHIILFEHLTKEKAIKKEIELIEKYNLTDGKYGYNITKGGDGLNGMIMSDNTKKKMSENHYDCKGAKNPASRKVINLDTLIIYDTLKDASLSIGMGYTHKKISKVCSGVTKYTKDINGNKTRWMYLDDYNKIIS